MCKAVPYLQGVSVCASVNTLVVIAVDRYVAICHVMRQRNTKRMARFILLVIWLLSMLLLIPWALFYEHVYIEKDNKTFAVCHEKFPTVAQKKAYFLGVIFLMCYTLPLTLIAICYFKIGYRVWHRDAPGITSSKGVIEKSKIRVVKMLAVVVLLFMISWMPLYIMRLTLDFFPPEDAAVTTIHNLIIPFVQWLGTSNSCMNPLVYCLFSQKIRRRIRAMLCCSKPETRSLYSTRSMYNSALQHSTSTRESSLRLDSCTNGHSSAGHYAGGGSLYHHYRPTRQDSELIRMHRSHLRSTHV
ncbi:unnamed protein product [Lymnaea stagnalis]|uniref:G-protein coupled receptors family 1 profile domain-containing protein n=1 Tax=Lymnaea stagnalis TaxID=6523 RepID=A0AAV2H698_LYMST